MGLADEISRACDGTKGKISSLTRAPFQCHLSLTFVDKPLTGSGALQPAGSDRNDVSRVSQWAHLSLRELTEKMNKELSGCSRLLNQNLSLVSLPSIREPERINPSIPAAALDRLRELVEQNSASRRKYVDGLSVPSQSYWSIAVGTVVILAGIGLCVQGITGSHETAGWMTAGVLAWLMGAIVTIFGHLSEEKKHDEALGQLRDLIRNANEVGDEKLRLSVSQLMEPVANGVEKEALRKVADMERQALSSLSDSGLSPIGDWYLNKVDQTKQTAHVLLASLPNRVSGLLDEITIREIVLEWQILGEPDSEQLNALVGEVLRAKYPAIQSQISKDVEIAIKGLLEDAFNDLDTLCSRFHVALALDSQSKGPREVFAEIVKQSLKVDAGLEERGYGDNTAVFASLATGVGASLVGVLSGGAGVALLASGPVGWILGALGGYALIKNSDGLQSFFKGAAKRLGFGLTAAKLVDGLRGARDELRRNSHTHLADSMERFQKEMTKGFEEVARSVSAAALEQQQKSGRVRPHIDAGRSGP